MMKKDIPLLAIGSICLIAVLLSGCSSTPRGLKHVPTEPAVVVDVSQSTEEQAFAEAGARLKEGVEVVVPATPIGLAQVRAAGGYMNALGENCRRLKARNGNAELSCGICLGKDGIWRYVPLHP